MCKECGCGIADKKNPLYGKGAKSSKKADKKTPAKKTPAKKK